MLSKTPIPTSVGLSNLGNTAGDTGLVSNRIVLVGTNNITLSGSTNGASMTISISGGAGAAGNTGYISAGTNTASLGTVVFSNSNGVSFGANGQTITASHNGLTSQSNQAVSADNGSYAFQTLSFSNANGVSFGTSAGSAITASISTSLTNINVSAGTTSYNLSAVTFANGNNVTFGIDGSTITASVAAGGGDAIRGIAAGGATRTTNTVNFSNENGISFGFGAAANSTVLTASHNALTSQSNQAFSADGGSSAFQTLSFSNANGISFSNNAGQVQASYTVPTITNSSFTVSDNGTSGTVAQLAFTNLNGVTLSLSTGAGGSHTIVGSHNALTSQSNQAVSGSNGSYTFQTATFGNLNGLSFYTSNGSMVGSYTVPTLTNSSLTMQAGASTLSSVSRIAFVDSNGISFGASTSNNGSITITASHNGLTSQSNQALSGSNGSFTFQTATFGNLNGLSFYTSNGSIVGSYTVPIQILVGNSTQGNTSGDTGFVTGRFALVGSNNITLSGSTDGGSMTITISGATVAGQPVNFSAGTTSNNLGTVVFSNSNGVSFGLNGSTITGSVATSLTNVNLSAGTTSNNLSAFVLSNSNGLSFGLNGSTVTASAAASSLAAGTNITISTDGATISIIGKVPNYSAGTTSNNINSLVFSNSNNVSFGLSGSTITASASYSTIFNYEPYPAYIGGANTGITNVLMVGSGTSGSVAFFPFDVHEYVAAGYLNMVISQSFSTLGNSSGQQTGLFRYGLYTRGTGTNSTTMSRFTSSSFSWAITGNNSSYTISQATATNTVGFTYSTTASAGSNISSGYTGMKLLVLPIGTTLSPGSYWLGIMQTQSTSSIIVGLSNSLRGFNFGASVNILAPIGSFTTAYSSGTNAYGGFGGGWYNYHGSWSTVGNTGLPDTVGLNSVTMGALSFMPMFRLWSST